MLADIGSLVAFVNVFAVLTVDRFPKSGFAMTNVRARCVLAFRVDGADNASIAVAFVHIFAHSVRVETESDGTFARVTSLSVFANLVGATLVSPFLTFVDVFAIRTKGVRFETSLTGERAMTLVGTRGIDAPFVTFARVIGALVDVGTASVGVQFHSGRAVDGVANAIGQKSFTFGTGDTIATERTFGVAANEIPSASVRIQRTFVVVFATSSLSVQGVTGPAVGVPYAKERSNRVVATLGGFAIVPTYLAFVQVLALASVRVSSVPSRTRRIYSGFSGIAPETGDYVLTRLRFAIAIIQSFRAFVYVNAFSADRVQTQSV